MNPKTRGILVLVSTGLWLIPVSGTHASSGEKDLPPGARSSLMKELSALEAHERQIREGRIAGALARIREAEKSGPAAVELHLAAFEQMRFRNQPAEFQAWRKRNQDLLHGSGYEDALQFQLRYLMMALAWNDTPDPAPKEAASLAYLRDLYGRGLVGLPPGIPPEHGSPDPSPRKGPTPPPSPSVIPQEAFTLLGTPLANTPVAAWYGLAPFLPSGDFEQAAGNAEGILEKNIRNPMRTARDPGLPLTWDEQVRLESSLLKTDAQKEAFRSERLPVLLASRAADTAAIGQPLRALSAYIDLVRNYPEHPKVMDWIDAAKSLSAQSSDPIPSPSQAQSTSPATSGSP